MELETADEAPSELLVVSTVLTTAETPDDVDVLAVVEVFEVVLVESDVDVDAAAAASAAAWAAAASSASAC